MKRIYHIGLSGGKDSTALLLFMAYESGISHDQLIATFCDTQNEADETYEHLTMLHEKVFPVTHINTEGFLNLAKRKQRFPSAKARFCTQELKLKPTKLFLESLTDKYDEVIPCSGVRKDESEARKHLTEWKSEVESYFGMKEWRPLVDWKFADILAIHKRHNIPLNPLYHLGAKRVGCFPCFHSQKAEILLMVKLHPERITELAEWEKSVAKESGFFARGKVPERFRSREIKTKDGTTMKVPTVFDVVEWAKTGSRTNGLAPDIEGGLFDLEPDPENGFENACTAGVCE
jgi:3'-phosphoadenosine 5'-phosphosulfate sulfotransferase (PAPS reductase)/FAD synthetase